MEIIIAIIIATYATGRAGSDLLALAKGKTPPRFELAMKKQDVKAAKLAGRSVRPAKKTRRHPAMEYGSVLWRDSWDEARGRHDRRLRERRERREAIEHGDAQPTPFQQWIEKRLGAGISRWDDTWEKVAARHEKKKAEREEEARRRQEVRDTYDYHPPESEKPAPESTEPEQTPTPDPASASEQASETEDPNTTDQTEPTNPDTDNGSDSNTEQSPTTEGNTTVSTNIPAGEATGLASAVAFNDQMAAAMAEATQSIEGVAAGLEQGQVTGAAIAHYAEAQEAANAVAAALAQASAVLHQHMQVKDAYESTNNEAGTKEFVTTE